MLFLIAVPITLVLVLGRRQKRVREATAASWTGVVTHIEVLKIKVKTGVGSTYMPYLQIHYRTADGVEGTVAVGDAHSAGALSMSTMQPLPPEGYHAQVNSWREGDEIVKDAGSYYPRLIRQ